MKLTESQLRKIIRSVLMVEAATLSFDDDKIENSEYKLARFNQSLDSKEGVKQGLSNAKFVAAEGNTDPYGYYVDAGRVIKWIKAPEGEKKLTVDVVSKGDKQLKNKSFDITPENISKGGIKKLALAFASVMENESFRAKIKAGQNITDEQINSFLSFLLQDEAATDPYGESEQEPSSPEQEPGESKQEVDFYIRKAKKGDTTVGQQVGTSLGTIADYQEKELVPLDNILLNPQKINNRMHVPTKPYSKYNSYIDKAITLEELIKKSESARVSLDGAVRSTTSGFLLHNEFKNSENDSNGQVCYKFASDVNLIVYFKPGAFVENSDFKLKDGAEAILFINGPLGNNCYIKDYKLDAATGRLNLK